MFQLAVAGEFPQNLQLARQVSEILGQIKAYLSPDLPKADLRLLVSPPYTGNGWQNWAEQSGCSVTACSGEETEGWEALCDQFIRFASPLRDEQGEALCDRADLLLMLWNEDVTERSGASWELLRMAHRKKMPCVWISSRSREIYWPDGSYFEPYRPEQLKKLCEMVSASELSPFEDKGETIPFLGLGKKLRAGYLRRFKADTTVRYEEKDRLLQETYHLNGSGEKLRNKLLSCFRRFDLSAVSLNERYQAVIYWRAILPFLSALFIAVGFYASTFPGSLPLPVPSSFWKNVEGIGFLIYAVINLYVFSLSRNKTIKAWHQGFLRDRYIAELLRVVLHFAPFGVLLDLRKLCGDRKEICTAVRHLCAAEDSGIERLDKENSEQILLHLRELLDDQIAYHSSARKRYDRLVRHLERFARTSFIIGFVVVILRALLQFFLNTLPLPDWNLSDGISVDSLLRTVFNMLALLVPAWAAYFSSKLTLCNFRFDCDYHKRMMTLLLQEQKRMDRLQETFDDIPAEAIVAMGEHLAEIMLLKDTAEWQEQYESATVSQL